MLAPDDLGTYLGIANIDIDRATFIIEKAIELCQAIVNPLPDGSDSVVLDVAVRAWTNPTNAQAQTAGPYNTAYGAIAGGLWLTAQNKSTLRLLAGGGSAFMIDTTPAGAMANLPWWDTAGAVYTDDWDQPA